MPRFEEFQFIVTPVLLLVDDDSGRVPRAVEGEPRVLHGVEELVEFAHRFDDNLEMLNAANNGKAVHE